jgi:cobalt-precorrin 5A hydrolase
MKIAIVTINNPSLNSAKELLVTLNNHNCTVFNKTQEGNGFIKFDKLDDILSQAWIEFDAIIFIMATGAVIRKIAPHLKNKASDPAVLIMTLDLKKVIPLISGHLGGANELSQEIAKSIKDCVNFLTTASDQVEVLAFDMFAKKYNYKISNLKSLAEISNRVINKQTIQVVCYPVIIKQLQEFDGYKNTKITFFTPDNLENLDNLTPTLYITPQKLSNNSLGLHPHAISLGLGMNRGTSKEEISLAIKRFCYEHQIEQEYISTLASFDAKADEIGLLELAKELDIELKFFSDGEINSLTQEFSPSQATKFFNIKGVAEPASLLASRYKTLFLSKRIYGNVTIAASF